MGKNNKKGQIGQKQEKAPFREEVGALALFTQNLF
jgi:hypothetical protein